MSDTTEAPISDLPEGFFTPDETAVAEPATETAVPAETSAEPTTAEPAEPAESEASEPAEDDKPKRDPWFMRRIAQLTAKEAAASQRAAELEARVEALQRGEKPTNDPEVQRAIAARAAEIAEQQVFNAECNRVAAAGKAAFPDFNHVIASLWEATGGPGQGGALLPTQVALVNAALETGDAHRVLYELGRNPDEADRIASLSPARMGAAIAKLAAKPALPVKQPTKLPPPIKPVGAASSDPSPNGSMADFDKWFESQRRR